MEIEMNQGVLKRFYGDEHELILHDEVTEIGESAFLERFHLQRIILPSSVNKIGNWAFSRCRNLTAIELSTGIKSIGRSAFRSCDKLESIIIPDSVEEMQGKVFEFCKELKSVILPSHLSAIGEKTFSYCTNLESIEIPYGVKKIGAWAFEGCYRLKEIHLPETVEEIGECAFIDSTSLEQIKWKGQIKEIGYHAFLGTAWIENQDNDFLIINHILVQYLGSDSVIQIPECVYVIGNHAFEDCRQITTVILSKQVIEIREKAFEDCIRLKSVVISKYLRSIHDTAFHGCKKLQNLVFKDILAEQDITFKVWNTHRMLYQAYPNDLVVYLPSKCYKIKFTKFIQENNNSLSLNMLYFDEIFDTMDEMENKLIIAIMRLLSPYQLSDRHYKCYDQFIREQIDAFLDYLLEVNNIFFLRAIAGFHMIEREKADELIQLSTQKQLVEITGFLLQYKHEEFGYEEEYCL